MRITGRVLCERVGECHANMHILCVTDEFAVEQILFGQNGIGYSTNNDLVIVDHSTISPSKAKAISKKITSNNRLYLDAPITGSVPGAINGTLVIYVGGDKKALDMANNIFRSYSKKATLIGNAGSGQATKMCNQIMLHNLITATFETINLANNQGLDLDTVLEAFEGILFDSEGWRIFSHEVISSQYKRLAHIKDVYKDLKYIESTADENHSPIYLTKQTMGLIKQLMDAGLGNGDILELMSLYTKK